MRQYLLVQLTSTVLIALTSQQSDAFQLFYTPRVKDYIARSDFPQGTGITTLDAVNPDTAFLTPFGIYPSTPFIHQIKRGGTDGLLTELQLYTNEGWTFNKGRDLRGSFNVRRLYACGTQTVCGQGMKPVNNKVPTDTNVIGATLELDYRPSLAEKSRDPKPNKDNLYWIQRIVTNYPSPPPKPGVYQNYIDNRDRNTGANATYPYYNGGVRIGSDGYFGDRPIRRDFLDRNYFWTAELYLAQADKSNRQNVTIFNGLSWGWLYQYVPKKDDPICPAKSTQGDCSTPIPTPTPTPTPPPCNPGSGGGGCDRTSMTDYTYTTVPTQLKYSQTFSTNVSNSENVPHQVGNRYINDSYYHKSPVSNVNDASDHQYDYVSILNFDDISSNDDQQQLDDNIADANRIEDQEQSSLDNYDDSESPVPVPESTSVFGLLALAAWGTIKALKIRKDKQS